MFRSGVLFFLVAVVTRNPTVIVHTATKRIESIMWDALGPRGYLWAIPGQTLSNPYTVPL